MLTFEAYSEQISSRVPLFCLAVTVRLGQCRKVSSPWSIDWAAERRVSQSLTQSAVRLVGPSSFTVFSGVVLRPAKSQFPLGLSSSDLLFGGISDDPERPTEMFKNKVKFSRSVGPWALRTWQLAGRGGCCP